MKDRLTVIILARNELDMTKLCLQCLHLFMGIDNYEVILVDNHSEDGTYEWACQQEGISVAAFDDEVKPWGLAINSIIKEFKIENDILLIPAWCAITGGCVGRMLELTDRFQVVGCTCNESGIANFSSSRKIADYRDALVYAEEILSEKEYETSMGLSATPIWFCRSVFDEVGNFDENIFNLSNVFTDYSLRLLEKSIKIVVARRAFCFAMGREVIVDPDNERDLDRLRVKHDSHYFNLTPNPRLTQIIADDIDKSGKRNIKVLEIGCDMGATLYDIKQKVPEAELYGCELNEAAARVANYFSNTVVGNIEEEKLPFEEGLFDYIILGDVLEHLRNPKAALIYVKKLLSNEGKVVASIPNLMNIMVIKELLKGNFTYTETGLLDKTHIHFFTYNEIMKIFNEAGYSVLDVAYTNVILGAEDEALISKLTEIQPAAEPFMYRAFQYLVIAGGSKN